MRRPNACSELELTGPAVSRYRFVVKVGDKEGLGPADLVGEIGPARFSRWRDLHKYIGKKLAGCSCTAALTYLLVPHSCSYSLVGGHRARSGTSGN